MTMPFILRAPLTALLFVTILSSIAIAESGEPEKLTQEQLITIRDRLRSIVTDYQEAKLQKNTSLTGIFVNASASPRDALDFYLECVEEVDFLQKGRTSSDFRGWKDRHGQDLKNDDFARALQILLRYLAISTEADKTNDDARVVPLLTAYIDGLLKMDEVPGVPDPRRGGGGILEPPINESVFAIRYDLFRNLRGGGKARDKDKEKTIGNTGEVSWEPRPLNIGGMYEKTILPYLYQISPDKIAGAWAKRIDQQGKMAILKGDATVERFRTRGLPTLQWEMMVDQYQVGYQVSAVSKMLEHIESHKKSHPDAGKWVQEAIGLLFADADIFAKE